MTQSMQKREPAQQRCANVRDLCQNLFVALCDCVARAHTCDVCATTCGFVRPVAADARRARFKTGKANLCILYTCVCVRNAICVHAICSKTAKPLSATTGAFVLPYISQLVAVRSRARIGIAINTGGHGIAASAAAAAGSWELGAAERWACFCAGDTRPKVGRHRYARRDVGPSRLDE